MPGASGGSGTPAVSAVPFPRLGTFQSGADQSTPAGVAGPHDGRWHVGQRPSLSRRPWRRIRSVAGSADQVGRPAAAALPVLLGLGLGRVLQQVADLLGEHLTNLLWGGEEELAARVGVVTLRSANALCSSVSSVTASSEKYSACTSNGNGTEASPSSRMRSIGSSRRVMPILTTDSPNAPMLLMTYTYPARMFAAR